MMERLRAVEAKHPPGHRRSRRELVVAGAAGAVGAAVAVVATSGSKSPPTPRPTPPQITAAADLDIVVLSALLEFERHAVKVYSLATVALIGGALETAETLLAQERQHAGAVDRAIRDLGGTPAPTGAFDEWDAAQAAARGRRTTLAALHALEQRAVGIYLDAVAQITTEDVRATVAEILASEAEHLAVVTGELGVPQLETPFVVGTGG